jgi:cob(I)alamin adenosyltransferase
MNEDDDAINERHRKRVQRKKAVVDEKIAQANIDRGVLIVNCGNGKGKSSSGFGMVARALGDRKSVV